MITLLAVLLLIPAATLGEERPIVGAIRWDAWYGDGSVKKAMEASLGQPKYHFRLPWFAQVQSDGKVSINGDSQVIMEQAGAALSATRVPNSDERAPFVVFVREDNQARQS